jgi:hypothetical protein
MSRYRSDISRSAGVTTLNNMNFLIAIISPNSNPEESALLKGSLPVDDFIEIWLAEVTRVSRRPVFGRRNYSDKDNGTLATMAEPVA